MYIYIRRKLAGPHSSPQVVLNSLRWHGKREREMIYIWMNYSDFTVTSLVSKGNHPQIAREVVWTYFRY